MTLERHLRCRSDACVVFANIRRQGHLNQGNLLTAWSKGIPSGTRWYWSGLAAIWCKACSETVVLELRPLVSQGSPR